jgi:aldose 1-epimerase
MPISELYCYTDDAGKEVKVFTLSNEKGSEVSVTNYGGIITSFKVINTDGKKIDIVLGFDKVQDYTSVEYLRQYSWIGCTVGRYANRIGNGAFTLDGKEYHVSKNNGNNQLHGGFEGFDKKTWDIVAFGNEPFPYLELRYTSPDGEEGFPGDLEIHGRFELNDENELSYQFTGSANKPTAVNLTHHGYFNLDGEGDIKEHELKIYGSSVLDQDEDLVANGKIIPIKNTAFDFHQFRSVSNGLEEVHGYDKSFLADKPGGEETLSLMAEVRSARSGFLLQVYSTEPVLHFYSGTGLPALKGKDGIVYGPFSGLCLETQKHPNAINIPHFPNTLLRPGEAYFQKNIYKIIS